MALHIYQVCFINNFLFAGANINESDKFGTTPLYRAIDCGWEEIVEFLLDNRCDVNKGSASETCFSAIVRSERLNPMQYAKRLSKTGINYPFSCLLNLYF